MGQAYGVEQFRDPAAEVERLRLQAAVVSAEEAALDRLQFPAIGRILDLGCGPGFVAERLRRRRPALRIVGLDRDRQSLSLAARRVAPVAGDAAALPVATGAFDFAHLRLVLRHLPDPGAVLGEVWRALRPGGGVAVIDSDDGALVLEPPPEGFAEVLAARQRTFQRRGADPFIGRRLPGLLAGAGFSDLQVVPLPVTSGDLGPAGFAAIVLAPVADAIDPDLCPPEQVRQAAEAVRAWGMRTDVFGMTTAIVAGGHRPQRSDGNLPATGP
jgi:SAM-dependent methyltransferase